MPPKAAPSASDPVSPMTRGRKRGGDTAPADPTPKRPKASGKKEAAKRGKGVERGAPATNPEPLSSNTLRAYDLARQQGIDPEDEDSSRQPSTTHTSAHSGDISGSRRKGPPPQQSGESMAPDDSSSQLDRQSSHATNRLDRLESGFDDLKSMMEQLTTALLSPTGQGSALPNSARARQSPAPNGPRSIIHHQPLPMSHVQDQSDDEEAANSEEEGPPPRGPYGTFPLHLKQQFAFLDPQDLEAALAWKLPPTRLHRLLHPQSPWYVEAAQRDDPVMTLTIEGSMPKSTGNIQSEAFRQLLKGLSTPLHFSVAWGTLTTLMAWRSDTSGTRDIIRAMKWYGDHIIELSATYTWESCLRVFVDHAVTRLTGAFHVSHWYEAANASQQMKLLVPRTSTTASASSSHTPSAKVSFGAGREEDVLCNNFNFRGCSSKNCRRVHKCHDCGSKLHGAKDCPKQAKRTD